MTYKEYLQSPEWKRKRDERVLIDGKCAICGRPFDLNVHHLTYKNVPHEKIGDLVTLCRTHHEEIEKMKHKPWYDSFWALNRMLAIKFCEEYADQDLSSGGKYNFCDYADIKKLYFPFLKEHIGTIDNVAGCLHIQNHFCGIRCEIIREYYRKGYPQDIVHNRTLFSRNMIKKVYESMDSIGSK